MNEEHVAIVQRGRAAISSWRSEHPNTVLDLNGADLSKLNLKGADLRYADIRKAKVTGADLTRADLRESDLSRADLGLSDFSRADLTGAKLIGADLSYANLNATDLLASSLIEANLSWADFDGAVLQASDLSGANLSGASLAGANLSQANLSRANLTLANFTSANLVQAIFRDSHCSFTVFASTDFSDAAFLETVQHNGPSEIGIGTLLQSKGDVSTKFLLGCGVPAWMVAARRLFDPELTPNECAELLSTEVFMSRVQKTVFFGGAFLSYSHADRQFVDRLYQWLLHEGMPAWLDTHDAVAGPLGKQVTETIRSRDVVILVLSQYSLQSDWVWHEIRTARDKEKKESRYILCPITLDDAWSNPAAYGPQVQKAVEDHQVEIGYLMGNNILPFHDPHPFDPQFSKLIRGIVRYYGRPAERSM